MRPVAESLQPLRHEGEVGVQAGRLLALDHKVLSIVYGFRRLIIVLGSYVHIPTGQKCGVAFVFAWWSAKLLSKKVEPNFCYLVGFMVSSLAILLATWYFF